MWRSVFTVALVACSGPTNKVDAPQFSAPVGVMRYDAWSSDTDQTYFDHALDPAWRTDYAYREPSRGWSLYGTAVDAQAIADAEIQEAAANGIDFFWHLKYPDASVIGGTPDDLPAVTAINTPWQRHLTSPYKLLVKIAFICEAAWLRYPPYPNFPTFNGGALGNYQYLVQFAQVIGNVMLDPAYQRILNRPLLGLFGSSNMDATHWTTFLNTIVGITGVEPFVVDVNHNTSQASALGEDGVTIYGPNPASLSAGQHPYSDQIARDMQFWPAVGFALVPGVTMLQNAQPRGGTPGYADQPSQPELVGHVRDAGNWRSAGFAPVAVAVYNWDEYMEGGPGANNTLQEAQRYQQAILWAKFPSRAPSSFTYELSACNIGGGVTQSWTQVSGVTGAHDQDEAISSTVSQTITFTHIACLQIQITATTGPDRGIFDVSLDGGAPIAVDLYAAGATPHVTVWTSSALDGTTHGVTVTVTGTKNPSSSSVQIGIDTFRVTYDARKS